MAPLLQVIQTQPPLPLPSGPAPRTPLSSSSAPIAPPPALPPIQVLRSFQRRTHPPRPLPDLGTAAPGANPPPPPLRLRPVLLAPPPASSLSRRRRPFCQPGNGSAPTVPSVREQNGGGGKRRREQSAKSCYTHAPLESPPPAGARKGGSGRVAAIWRRSQEFGLAAKSRDRNFGCD